MENISCEFDSHLGHALNLKNDMEVKFYRTGGWVRDHLMGVESKDIDFSVVAPSFEAMKEAIEAQGADIKVEKPEYATVRAVHPQLGGVDYVLCRKDGYYSDGRRPDSVEPGSLADDLARRDFTINALAMDQDGKIVDLFGGQLDLEENMLRCVGDPKNRFQEDSLRMLRALRFKITKGFELGPTVQDCLHNLSLVDLLKNISEERIRDEMFKMFSHDTNLTLNVLDQYEAIRRFVFTSTKLWLQPTLKKL